MGKGICLALISNILFGLGYYFSILLKPLSDTEMLGLRIIILLPIILLSIFLFNQQHHFKSLATQIKKKPILILVIILLTLNTGVQLWLFLWAPNNNQAIQVSIGYLLLPLVAVALGKFVFKEHFSRLKKWALIFACLGVMTNVIFAEEISWATFIAGFGYPIYIALRRYFNINTLATFFVELLLLLPLSIYFLWQVNTDLILIENKWFYEYLILFGFINGSAFILYIYSSNLLPINILGLLGYAEPIVMLIISVVIGEILSAQSYILLICLIIAVLLLTIDTFSHKQSISKVTT